MPEPEPAGSPAAGGDSGRKLDAGPAVPPEPGRGRRVVVEGTAYAVFRTESGWAVFEDNCPHAGAPLSEGMWKDGHVICAWHGWKFDCRTGACSIGRGLPSAKVLAVREDGGRLWISRG